MDALGPLADGAALRRRARHRRVGAAHRVRRARRARASPALGRRRASLDDDAARGDDRAHERRPGGARRSSTTRPATAPARRCSSSSPTAARPRARPGAGHPPAARRRRLDAARRRAPARPGAVAGHAAGGRRRVRRGLPRRQRHGAAPRRRAAATSSTGGCRRWRRTRSTDVVPLLRRTFGAFEPAERRQLGRLRRRRGRARRRWVRPDVDPARGRRAGAGDGAAACSACPRTADGSAVTDGSDAVRVSETERLRRWRLVLGGGDADGTGAALRRRRRPHRRRARRALRRGTAPPAAAGGTRRGPAGSAARRPSVARWLGDIRRYFPTPVVQVLQRDAVERLDLRQLLLEPELLGELSSPTSTSSRCSSSSTGCCPTRRGRRPARSSPRVLAELEARLADRTRQAVRRRARPRQPHRAGRGPADIDWPRTIHANLRHWLPEHRTRRPRAARRLRAPPAQPRPRRDHRRRPERARWPTASCTPRCSPACSPGCRRCARRSSPSTPRSPTSRRCSPIRSTCCSASSSAAAPTSAQALGYCRQLVTRPRDTVLVLISDLFEGGNAGRCCGRASPSWCATASPCSCLLALSTTACPAHDHHEAAGAGRPRRDGHGLHARRVPRPAGAALVTVLSLGSARWADLERQTVRSSSGCRP